jgi:ribonuclease Z
MPRHFDPALVNDPFDDPVLYVDLVFERRALLFDIGDISGLPTRKLLRISDIFVTHRHMDHFAGFDHLLRRLLGREKRLGIYGPAGLVDAVEHKLKAYTWNLIEGYDGELTIRAAELDPSGEVKSAIFRGRSRFERSESKSEGRRDAILLQEAGLRVRATRLDHGGATVLAYALEERAQINIWRNKVEAMGLVVGPWLRAFKDAMLRGAEDAAPIRVAWRPERGDAPASLPLGLLKEKIMKVTAGRKIVYVVDCGFSDANQRKIIEIARNADILFIEATFLDADRTVAEARSHLTARQAGTLARMAKAKRLVTLHYSPRYRGEGARLEQEARQAFLES